MPTREAIVNTTLPREVEKPIPVRTISTRTQRANVNQAGNSMEQPAADSATPAESVRLSPQLTALARKEQAHRQREQALKERERQLEARLAEADKYSQLKTRFAEKDFSGAEELGLTYDEHTKYLLDKQDGEDPESQRWKALETEIQTLKKGQEDKATQEYEETVAEYRKELAKQAEESPDFLKVKKFKDTDAEGKEITGVDVALQFILDSWEEDSEEISIDEALKLTNTYLEERAQKWKALIEEPVAEPEAKPLPPPRSGSRTLTQQMQPAGNLKQPAKSLQHLSEQERYAEARRRVMERRQLEGR